MRTLIHDLPETLAPFFPEGSSEGSVTLRADGRCAPCKGCFACWLKQPGFCSMPDAFQHAGALIGQSDPLWIISRLCYGGYSSPIKAILDRSIGDSLPFFCWRGGQTHHLSRYPHRELLRVCFYGGATQWEQETARELVERNRLNWAYEMAEIAFYREAAQAKEACECAFCS